MPLCCQAECRLLVVQRLVESLAVQLLAKECTKNGENGFYIGKKWENAYLLKKRGNMLFMGKTWENAIN